MELYEIEKHALQIDIEKYEYDNSSGRTDDTNYSQRAENDYSSQRADDYYSQRADDDDENDILQTQVSHVQLPKMEKNTMLIMMKIHCVKWSTDQCMCHTMKTVRNYCCRKQQICHEKTI